MSRTNFLIGRGQMLTAEIPPIRRGFADKESFRSFSDSQELLIPQLLSTVEGLTQLPKEACPNDFCVMNFTLHPKFIAKSYYPKDFLRAAELTPIGSKSVDITVDKNGKKISTKTTNIFVAGQREALRSLNKKIYAFAEDSNIAEQFTRIEKISNYTPIISFREDNQSYYEVIIHLLQDRDTEFVKSSFKSYAEQLGFSVFSENFIVGNLWFVPIRGPREHLNELGKFAFIRVVHSMPRLRSMPQARSSGPQIECQLPTAQPISSLPRVALLDGGLPLEHPVNQWIGKYIKMDSDAKDNIYFVSHGLAVTSAFLFGPISPDISVSRPFSFVDNIRLLDEHTNNEDPLEMYHTLAYIEEILLSRQYEFLNLSLGPDLPIDDGEIHSWTAVIDDLLSDGNCLMTVAVGNNGEKDFASGNARIQVPADCVNALSVGSANDTSNSWKRSSYSAFGPGRRPGVIKPDILAFGGSYKKYFHTLIPGIESKVEPNCGTSFAAPYALRQAVGIRAILGGEISPLAIKALLIHCSIPNDEDITAIGWGKIPENIMDIITCKDGCARIIYQGSLKSGKFLRAQLPIPASGIRGKCKIKATLCYSCPVDPQDTCSYTRAGLEVIFRPHKDKLTKSNNVKTSPFFTDSTYFFGEEIGRRIGKKWENVLHAEKTMNGNSLNSPVFDIHYMAREGGADIRNAEQIPYALVLSFEANRHPHLFNDILNTYKELIHIEPQISLPVYV